MKCMCDFCQSAERAQAMSTRTYGDTPDLRSCFECMYHGAHRYRDEDGGTREVDVNCANFVTAADRQFSARQAIDWKREAAAHRVTPPHPERPQSPPKPAAAPLPVLLTSQLRVDRCDECGGPMPGDEVPSFDICPQCRRIGSLQPQHIEKVPVRIWLRGTKSAGVLADGTHARAWLAMPGVVAKAERGRVKLRMWIDWPGTGTAVKETWQDVGCGRIYVRTREVEQDGKGYAA